MHLDRLDRELARLADSAGPAATRAEGMLELLREHVPFDAAWLALSAPGGYISMASVDLDPGVLRYLSGPKMARDIAWTGSDRLAPPLSPSDLPYLAEDLETWAECLIPAGYHEALAVALYEPGGRHVGFLALLSAEAHAPTAAARRRVRRAIGPLAHAVDPLRSITGATALIGAAFAGVLLLAQGGTEPLPGLGSDDLLAAGSVLLHTVSARSAHAGVHLSFLWPRRPHAPVEEHVRVTFLAPTESPLPGLLGVVLLSPAGEVHGLTPRELEVLGMVVDGCSNQQIATRLVVTPRTVATHVEHILAKLGCPTRTHAAVHADREGVYVPPALAPD